MQLLKAPHFYEEQLIKASYTGIVFLKQGRYRNRYLGSKQFTVSPDGVLTNAVKKITPAPTGVTRRKLTKCSPYVRDKDKQTYTINKTEIRSRIFAMIGSQPPGSRQLYFWTITFPMKTNDETIYRLFNTWLTKLRERKLLKDYLWIAERQKNGTLHFHMCIPHTMNVKIANREMMVTLCNAARLGNLNNYALHNCKRYNGVDISKQTTFNNTTKQFERKKQATNFAQGKRGQRALLGYITKYVTKNNSSFPHLAWHNSRGFSSLFTSVTFTIKEFVDTYKLVDYVNRKCIIATDFFQFHPWKESIPPPLAGELFKINSLTQYLNNERETNPARSRVYQTATPRITPVGKT